MTKISTRQLCFFFAFLIPVSKLLETPSLLSYYAGGDLLFPALVHTILQGGMSLLILLFLEKIDGTFDEFLQQKLGKIGGKILYISLGVFYVFFTILPLLELEKFTLAAFFDTTPGIIAFLPFFLLAVFVASRPLSHFYRILDFCMPLFIFSFFPLLLMSVGHADFSALMPLFSARPRSLFLSVWRSVLHFSDTAFLLPLLSGYKPNKGDTKKVMISFFAGHLFLMIFLAVFYGVFQSLSPQRPFAFDTIAQYFSGLSVIGRVDLLLVYLLTVLLLLYYSLPILLSVHCFSTATGIRPLPLSAVISGLLLILTLFFQRFYPNVYSLVTTKFLFLYPLFAYALPLILLLLSKRRTHAKTT
jgi:hypothetical protein